MAQYGYNKKLMDMANDAKMKSKMASMNKTTTGQMTCSMMPDNKKTVVKKTKKRSKKD